MGGVGIRDKPGAELSVSRSGILDGNRKKKRVSQCNGDGGTHSVIRGSNTVNTVDVAGVAGVMGKIRRSCSAREPIASLPDPWEHRAHEDRARSTGFASDNLITLTSMVVKTPTRSRSLVCLGQTHLLGAFHGTQNDVPR